MPLISRGRAALNVHNETLLACSADCRQSLERPREQVESQQ